MRSTGAFLLAVILSVSSPLFAAEPAETGEGAVRRLVEQLGSRSYREREAAMAALLRCDRAAAIAHLRQVVENKDPEVCRRAGELLTRLERRVETESALRPQRIRLDYKDRSVQEVVADFASRTGLPLEIDAKAVPKLAERKITLKAGELTVWEAYDLLCAKAGLAEQPVQAPAQATPNGYSSTILQQRQIGGGQQIIWLGASSHHATAPQPAPKIVLGAGKAAPRPTFHAGALRIQAVPPSGKAPRAGPSNLAREATLTLDVDVEPRLGWEGIVAVRVERAVDDQGQTLTQPELFVGQENTFNGQANTLNPLGGGQVVVLWDGVAQPTSSKPRQARVRLRLGEKPARLVKELHGVLAAEIETPPEPLIKVGDVLKSAGKTFTGPDGSTVKVLEVEEDGGQYKLRVEVQESGKPSDPAALAGVRWVRIQRGGLRAATITLSPQAAAEKGLSLLDARGEPLLLATGAHPSQMNPGDAVVYTLYYQPKKGQGPPATFVYSGRRTVLVEVPFTLKDVPLP